MLPFRLAMTFIQVSQRSASVPRVASTTALLAKKKGRGGGNNEGAQPRERKEKDDVIEVSHKVSTNMGCLTASHIRFPFLPAHRVADVHHAHKTTRTFILYRLKTPS